MPENDDVWYCIALCKICTESDYSKASEYDLGPSQEVFKDLWPHTIQWLG